MPVSKPWLRAYAWTDRQTAARSWPSEETFGNQQRTTQSNADPEVLGALVVGFEALSKAGVDALVPTRVADTAIDAVARPASRSRSRGRPSP